MSDLLVERQLTATDARPGEQVDLVAGAWFRDDRTQQDDQQHALSALLAARLLLDGTEERAQQIDHDSAAGWVVLALTVLAAADPVRARVARRTRLASRAGSRPWWRGSQALRFAAAALPVAVLASPLLEWAELSEPTVRLAAGLVIAATAVVDVISPSRMGATVLRPGPFVVLLAGGVDPGARRRWWPLPSPAWSSRSPSSRPIRPAKPIRAQMSAAGRRASAEPAASWPRPRSCSVSTWQSMASSNSDRSAGGPVQAERHQRRCGRLGPCQEDRTYPGPVEALERYRAVVESSGNGEVKGAKNPYTSRNGHMFSFLDRRRHDGAPPLGGAGGRVPIAVRQRAGRPVRPHDAGLLLGAGRAAGRHRGPPGVVRPSVGVDRHPAAEADEEGVSIEIRIAGDADAAALGLVTVSASLATFLGRVPEHLLDLGGRRSRARTVGGAPSPRSMR